MKIPRILVAGLRGGSGKTLVSLGLVAAWRKKGYIVAPFKKGPDYIDAAWLSRAAGKDCRHLDLFLMSPRTIVRSFVAAVGGSDVALIEGNRGLYDGMDAQGTCSTAEVAKLLQSPVVIAVDCTKTTRTVAATVLGCQRLDPEVRIGGVILNQTAGPRHESVLRKAIETICGVPILGAVARIPRQLLPERHLGLVPPQEHDRQADAIEGVADLAETHLDLEALWNLSRQAPDIEAPEIEPPQIEPAEQSPTGQRELKPRQVRIGVFRDAVFQFYYPENLEALTREGASLIEISPLRETELPEVDALYIGGGFPETLAPALARNARFLDSLRRAIEKGLPVYAECGGAVFLGKKLIYDQNEYPMAGVLPVVFDFHKKPRGHGYVVLETVENNPFFSVGDSLRGHEFHYTCLQSSTADDLNFAFRVRRGFGFDGQRDGLCRHNVLASYTHLHALGTDGWAASVVQAAVRYGAR